MRIVFHSDFQEFNLKEETATSNCDKKKPVLSHSSQVTMSTFCQ